MLNFLVVGLGGFIGACTRYTISLLVSQWPSFPFCTLLSNVIAAVVIGFIIGVERQSALLAEPTKLFLTVGLLGGLSTFSAFSMETVVMLERGQYIHALGNILLNVGLCVMLVFAGLALAKMAVKV